MKPSFYQSKWDVLKKDPNKEDLDHLARQIALSFLDRYYYNDQHEEEYIRLLCEMATEFDDEDLNKAGSSTLFGIIVEGLCDDFEELQTEEYNRVMSRVVDFCRKTPGGDPLDQQLKLLGLDSHDDVFHRIESIRSRNNDRIKLDSPPEKIFLLSRVTIGADVAITSVLIQRLGRFFPNAEIIVLGGRKLRDIYGGNARIRIKEVDYSRHGNLVERFSSWFAVREAIEAETGGKDDHVIVVDPDSRLSQLGVLPIVRHEKYLFFNSRGSDAYPKKMSISELTNHWVDEVLIPGEFCYPRVWIPDPVLLKARQFASGLRQAGCRKIIVINFGVGGNARKRLGDAFEERLVQRLLDDPGTVIILDQGFGADELSRTGALIQRAKEQGIRTETQLFETLESIGMAEGLIGMEAGIGEIGALIAESQEFIGYDSACQHMAAALGVPSYTIFAGSNNPRFIRRWSACGPNKSEIIHVDTLTHPPMIDIDDVVTRITDAREE